MGLLHDSGTREKVAHLLARNLAAANILGRLHIAQHTLKKTGIVVPFSTISRIDTRSIHFAEETDDDSYMGFSTSLPPDQVSVDYLAGLTPVTKATFDGLTTQYQKLAFSIAGTYDQVLMKKIHDELVNEFKVGGTEADFRAAVDKLTDDAGVERLTAQAIDNAFHTNLATAYSLGRLEQMTSVPVLKALPIWQYWTVGDDRVRPEHWVLQGFAAQAIDPVWRKIYPPSGYNCRCSVVPILASEAPKDAMESGLERLPILAMLEVPQPGFRTLAA